LSVPIPTVEPTRFFAGVTVQWIKSLADFPAATWTLKYVLVGESNIEVTATADGSDFDVTIPIATTEVAAVGTYRLIGYVQDDPTTPTVRHQVYEGQCEIVLNPAFQAAGQQGGETRSFWRQVRDNLKSIITGKSAQSMSSYQIAGRNVNKMSWAEILDAYDRASVMVKQEEAAEARARGEQTGALVRIQFQRP